jgi:collagenase-like PrtC family protease
MTTETMSPALVMGPVLFNWSADRLSDFFARVADEAEVSRVHVGEVVCSKREPFFADRLPDAIERLTLAGKTVVVDALALPTLKRERQLVKDLAGLEGVEFEINDMTPLAHLGQGRRFAVSPLVNVYDEGTLGFLAARGAWSVALPYELPMASIERLAAEGTRLGIETQVHAFGRLPLAISGRCYHARIHGLAKDSCQFVCNKDPDGLEVDTLDGEAFLSINGVQTMSRDCVAVLDECERLVAAGVGAFRLSPHDCDMVAVAAVFRARLDGRISGDEARAKLGETGLKVPLGIPMMSGVWPATGTSAARA